MTAIDTAWCVLKMPEQFAEDMEKIAVAMQGLAEVYNALTSMTAPDKYLIKQVEELNMVVKQMMQEAQQGYKERNLGYTDYGRLRDPR